MVIELASDSYFAPGRTFVVPHDLLYDNDDESTKCTAPPCGRLPGDVLVLGAYVMSACVQSPPATCATGIDWNLGNNLPGSDSAEDTVLPVTATYRMLRDVSGDDVVSLGLPIQPVHAQPYLVEGPGDPGPSGGPSFAFQTYLPPGTYQQVIVPDPPFGSVFGPEVGTVDLTGTPSTVDEFAPVDHFDVTTETGQGPA